MDFSQANEGWSNRSIGFVTVSLLHVLILYIAITHSSYQPSRIFKSPFSAKIIKEIIKPPELPPTPTKPKIVTMQIPFVPPPEVPVTQVAAQSPIAVLSREAPAPSAAPAPFAAKQSTEASIGSSAGDVRAQANLESCKPSYPATSMIFEEQGVVRLRIDIGADDKVTDVTVVKSSGHKRLDQATVWAISRCSFKSAIHDGKPVASYMLTDYHWKVGGYEY